MDFNEKSQADVTMDVTQSEEPESHVETKSLVEDTSDPVVRDPSPMTEDEPPKLIIDTTVVNDQPDESISTPALSDPVVVLLPGNTIPTIVMPPLNKRKRGMKPVKRLEKGDPAQAKMRAVRATRRRRERATTAIARIRSLVPGIGPKTEHTKVIENLLFYLRFFTQAIEKTDLDNFRTHFANRPAAETISSKAVLSQDFSAGNASAGNQKRNDAQAKPDTEQ